MKRYEALRDLINNDGFKSVAEIGVRDGETMDFLLHNCPIMHYLGVDTHLSKAVERIMENHPRVKFSLTHSNIAYLGVPHHSLDLVFIDADHSYAAVKEDIENWVEKVRPGGVICGHDFCNPAHRGVEKAVREIFGDAVQEIPDPAFIWYVRKQ